MTEYAKDWNAAAALARVGYSKADPNREAYRILQTPAVAQAVGLLRAIAVEESICSHQECCQKLSEIIRADVPTFLTPSGEIDLDALRSTPYAAAIESIEIEEPVYKGGEMTRGRRVRIRLKDRVAAIERLSKMRGYDQHDRFGPPGTQVAMIVLPLEKW